MIDPETFNRLNTIPQREWLTIYKLLTLYATARLERFGFEIRSEVDNVNGQDFAQQAIEKLFDGSRAWDFERFPDLLIHLKGIVKSLISNHFKKSTRAASVVKKNAPLPPGGKEAEDLESAVDIADGEDPEDIMIHDEQWRRLEAAFEEDAEGYLIFCDWLEGKPPRNIAEEYQTDVKNVYNITKRGKRFFKKILLDQ
jgi:DNA-directed RNA polymerase specialized sigma24 family protein